MKVKNIMFSGVMAAILGATAANAADVDTSKQLISKKYADRALQHKLTTAEGSNVTLGEVTADGTQAISVDLSAYATTGAVDTAINNAVNTGVIKTAIDDVQADVDALDEKVGELPTGEGAATTIVEYINEKTTGIATNAALGELQTAVNTAKDDIDALEEKVGGDTVANQIAAAIENKADKATTLQGYGITDAYTKTEVDTELNKKANASDLEGYATDEELAAVSDVANAAQTAEEVATAIDGKIDALKLEEAYAAKSIEATVQTNASDIATLKAIDHSKYAVATEVEATYATKEALGTVEATANAAATKETVNAINGRLTTAESDIDALQQAADTYATKAEITNAKYMSGVGQAEGQYVVNFDGNGNATYTEITIVE